MDPHLFSIANLGLLIGALCVLLIGLASQIRALQASLARTRSALAAANQQAYYKALVADASYDGLIIQDVQGKIVWANPAYCDLMGYPLDQMLGRNPLSFCMPPDQASTEAEVAAFRYDTAAPEHRELHLWRNIRANGSLFWNQISVSSRTSPSGETHFILVCRDVTDQVEREAELRHTTARLAHNAAHDGLTGIGNRTTMVSACAAMLQQAHSLGHRVGMLHIDIDHFKDINDGKGHGAGDAVLIHVATVLQRHAREHDVVARVGGDEFVMVCRDVQGLPELREIAQAVTQEIAQPLVWQHHKLTVSLSIGVALSQHGARDAKDLIQHSDFALYEAKRGGRRRVAAYDEALHLRRARLTRRSQELSEAVKSDSLEFHFQPVVKWPTRQVLGFETLVRWNHPTDGMLPPGAFIAMAADMGLMADLDLAAMRAGIGMKLALRQAGLHNKVISFNASAPGLLHPDYIPQLRDLTTRHGLNPGHLTVEVLETVMFDDQMTTGAHADVISTLHNQGYKTVLDDFGVGHAGLSHLAKLHLTGVKIDRSLIADVETEKANSRIVATVLDLCGDLGLDVICEGVETDAVATALAGMGCEIMQGYGIARPMPAEAVVGWATDFHSRHARPLTGTG